MNGAQKLLFELDAEVYAVCRLDAAADDPAWARRGTFHSITRTPHELSVVCRASDVPPDVQAAREWRLLALRGPFAFDQIGIAAEFTSRLAEAGVSVFVISTYDTDLLFVRSVEIDSAVAALRNAGHVITAFP